MDESLVAQIEETSIRPPKSFQTDISRYVYDTLNEPDKIRTMHLHATRDRIECTIQQISFLDGGYQALSYVWGSPEKPFKAIVVDENGNELGYVPLTMNLQSALCDLRDAEEVKSKWIDQICIDQEGDEKNHQVALMGQIYRNASRVITYIGPAVVDEEEERVGIRLLQLLDEHFRGDYELVFQAGTLFKARKRGSEFPVVDLPRGLQDAGNGDLDDAERFVVQGWRWLLQVAYGEWTQRLWMVQEQLLNRDIVMLCGPSLLSWDAVAAIPMLFSLKLLPSRYINHFWQENRQHSIRIPVDVENAVHALWYQRQCQKKGWLTTPSVLLNMVCYEDSECWDPRDRIFALLAISYDATKLGIIPDYSKSTPASRVFLDASIRILQNSTELPLLIYACSWANFDATSETSDSTFTSVTPSWSLCPVHHPIPHNISFKSLTPHPRSLLSAPPRFSFNQSVIVLKGCFPDRISMSTSITFISRSGFLRLPDEAHLQTLSQILTSLTAVLIHLQITLHNVACLCRAIVTLPSWPLTAQERSSVNGNAAFHFWSYCRSLVYEIKTDARRIALDLDLRIEQWDSLIRDLAVLLSGIVGSDHFQPSGPLTREENRAADEVAQFSLVHGRSFCVTEKGRVCNAMNQAMQGDVVAALQGSDRLWILRPVGDRHRLVGDAYVEGLMSGEAYEGVDPDEVDHDIELI